MAAEDNNAATVSKLMQLAQVNPLLKNMMDLAMAQAQHGNRSQLDTLVKLAQAEKPQELGLFGKIGAGLVNAFKQGISGAASSAGIMAVVAYFTGNDPHSSSSTSYEQDKKFVAYVESESKDKKNLAKEAMGKAKEKNKDANEDSSEYRTALREGINQYKKDKKIPEPERMEVVKNAATFSALLGGGVGGVVGFFSRLFSAGEERRQEIIAWKIIHGEIGGPTASTAMQGGLPEGELITQNLPYARKGIGQVGASLT
jgi:hypothetical protein